VLKSYVGRLEVLTTVNRARSRTRVSTYRSIKYRLCRRTTATLASTALVGECFVIVALLLINDDVRPERFPDGEPTGVGAAARRRATMTVSAYVAEAAVVNVNKTLTCHNGFTM